LTKKDLTEALNSLKGLFRPLKTRIRKSRNTSKR